MDALLYRDYTDPIPAPWYQCCGCAQSGTPQAGCGCVCHETRQDFADEEMLPMKKMTLLDYLRSFKTYSPIPPSVMTAGELVEILEELHELRERQNLESENHPIGESVHIITVAQNAA